MPYGLADLYPGTSHMRDSKTYLCAEEFNDKEFVSPVCGGVGNTLFNCPLRLLAPPVACMDVIDWLERRGYVANYPGEWIALSGSTSAEGASLTDHKGNH